MRALAVTYAGKLALAFIAATAALFSLYSPVTAQDAQRDTITSVELEIDWADGKPGEGIAAEVKEAIQRTLQLAIMEQLGASIPRLEANKEQITSTLLNVFDLVLDKRGMKLTDIAITPAENTLVRLAISLIGDKLESISVDFRFPSDTPLLGAVTASDRDAISAALEAKLGGAPVSDLSWVEKLIVREVLAELAARNEYVGFDPLVLTIPDAQAKVIITLLPRFGEAVVERYFVKLRSGTMLNLQLSDVGSFVGANMESLRGLPVGFVKGKNSLICGYLEKETVFAPDLAIASPVATAELYIAGADASLVFTVESQKFRLSASGRVDFNRPTDNARLDFSAGLRVLPTADVWAHGTFYPGEFELRPQAGIGFRNRDRAFAEFGYDFKMNSAIARAQLNLLPDFYLSAEAYAEDKLKDENEYGITYIFRNIYELKVITDFRDEIFASLGVRL